MTWQAAVASYEKAHPPAPTQAAALVRLGDAIGWRTSVDTIGQEAADTLAARLCRSDASPATILRQVIGPLRAVLMHAARRKWCDIPTFEVPDGAGGEKRTRWLTPAEAHHLRDAAAPHLRPLIAFLLGTGARTTEALTLDWSAVDLRHARATLTEGKNDGRPRHVDLYPSVVIALANLPHREGMVFRPPAITRGKKVIRHPEAYRDTGGTGGGQIATAFNAACRRAGIVRDSGLTDPDGKPVLTHDASPHVLRHTWASWRFAYHGNLLRLRDEGGWSSVTLVERYAKCVPPALRPEIIAFWGIADEFAGTALTHPLPFRRLRA